MILHQEMNFELHKKCIYICWPVNLFEKYCWTDQPFYLPWYMCILTVYKNKMMPFDNRLTTISTWPSGWSHFCYPDIFSGVAPPLIHLSCWSKATLISFFLQVCVLPSDLPPLPATLLGFSFGSCLHGDPPPPPPLPPAVAGAGLTPLGVPPPPPHGAPVTHLLHIKLIF